MKQRTVVFYTNKNPKLCCSTYSTLSKIMVASQLSTVKKKHLL